MKFKRKGSQIYLSLYKSKNVTSISYNRYHCSGTFSQGTVYTAMLTKMNQTEIRTRYCEIEVFSVNHPSNYGLQYIFFSLVGMIVSTKILVWKYKETRVVWDFWWWRRWLIYSATSFNSRWATHATHFAANRAQSTHEICYQTEFNPTRSAEC